MEDMSNEEIVLISGGLKFATRTYSIDVDIPSESLGLKVVWENKDLSVTGTYFDSKNWELEASYTYKNWTFTGSGGSNGFGVGVSMRF